MTKTKLQQAIDKAKNKQVKKKPVKVVVVKKIDNKQTKSKVKSKLNFRQKKFCKLFASDREFFCNGVQSYIEAFSTKKNKTNYKSAVVLAHRLLTKVNITTYIDKLFKSKGLNDVFVDKQLEKLLTQDADFSSKMKAIIEYNKLKKRITSKLEISGELSLRELCKKAKNDNN